MSKVTYKFDLADADDREDFLRAVKADDMAMVLWLIASNFRKNMEYYYEGIPDEEYNKMTPMDGVEKLMDEIYAEMDSHGIDIYRLVS